MAESTRGRKLQKLVENQPDSLLAKIFTYLPLKERFQLSAVCKQWRDASRIPWSDIKRLSLSEFPSAGVSSILGICPVREAVISRDQRIILDDLSMPPILPHLESLKLYDVCFALQDSGSANRIERKYERLLIEYFDRFPNLSELIWHNMYAIDSQGNLLPGKFVIPDWTGGAVERCTSLYIPPALAHSLRRLQITYGPDTFTEALNTTAALSRLANLECLYVGGQGVQFCLDPGMWRMKAIADYFLAAIGKLTNLRELCFGELRFMAAEHLYLGEGYTDLNEFAAIVCEKLLKLEVLIFASSVGTMPFGFDRLLTSHPSLRILIISGQDGFLQQQHQQLQQNFVPTLLPRRLLRSPVNHPPLPHLHVFVGGDFLQFVRFRVPEKDAAVFTEIDCPMPEFLAKPEVAEVFEGVWVAKMIREGAENGMAPWGSPNRHNLFYSQNWLQFAN